MTAITASASGPRLRITPRGRAVVAVLIAAPLAVGAVAFGLGQVAAASPESSAASASSSSAYRWVTVGSGESLWSIARRIAPTSDPRDVIDDIMRLNQLQSAGVSAGERLAVPTRFNG